MTIEDQGLATQGENQELNTSEVSIEDTIRDTLRGMQEKGDSEEVSVEGGEALEKEPDIAEEKPEEVKIEQETQSKAPSTWRKEVAEKWATLPPEVRAEVERRESDIHKGIEQYKQAAQFAHSMDKAISPYYETIQKLGISPEKAVSELMAADNRLRNGAPQEKLAYFSQLAAGYGIDIQALASGEYQQYQPDPTVSALQKQVQDLSGWRQQQESAVQMQAQQQLDSEIAKFASDPNHKHFETVKAHMAALLQAGVATDLKEAYEQAVYANQHTRAAVLAEQQAAAKVEAAKKVKAAKEAAGINIKSRAPMPRPEQAGSMEDTIRNTLRKLAQ